MDASTLLYHLAEIHVPLGLGGPGKNGVIDYGPYAEICGCTNYDF